MTKDGTTKAGKTWDGRSDFRIFAKRQLNSGQNSFVLFDQVN